MWLNVQVITLLISKSISVVGSQCDQVVDMKRWSVVAVAATSTQYNTNIFVILQRATIQPVSHSLLITINNQHCHCLTDIGYNNSRSWRFFVKRRDFRNCNMKIFQTFSLFIIFMYTWWGTSLFLSIFLY